MWFTKIWKETARTKEDFCILILLLWIRSERERCVGVYKCVSSGCVCVKVRVKSVCVHKIEKRIEIVTDSDTHGLRLQLKLS